MDAPKIQLPGIEAVPGQAAPEPRPAKYIPGVTKLTLEGLTKIDDLDLSRFRFNQPVANSPDAQQQEEPFLVHFRIGTAILRGEGRSGSLEDAVKEFQLSVSLAPNFFEGHFNLASAFLRLDRKQDAIDVISAALAIWPRRAPGWYQLGFIYQTLNNDVVSAAMYDHACSLDPNNPRYRWDRCQQFLSLGDFKNGWAGSEARLKCQKEFNWMRDPVPPYWQGENPKGRKLVIWSEQGIGEHLFTAQFYHEAAALFDKVYLEAHPRLLSIMKRSFPEIEVYPMDSNGDRYESYRNADYQIPAMSLGQFFRQDLVQFPDRIEGYLVPDADKVAELRAKYEALAQGRPIIGLAWKSTARTRGLDKSVALADMSAIWKQDAFFVSIQYGEHEERTPDMPIYRDLDIDPYGVYEGQLAQVAAMDVVIACSNTILHTAGALNVPTMAIIPDGRTRPWYWLLRRRDCPWYPSVILYRPEPGTDDGKWYGTSVKRIAAHVAEAIAANKKSPDATAGA